MAGHPLPAIAMRDAVATPWPSGPVVVSTRATSSGTPVAGTLAVELAEALDVIERDRDCAQRSYAGSPP